MEEKHKTIDILTTEVISYFQKLSYSETRIAQYKSAWQRVITFIEENKIFYYDATVGEAFIYAFLGVRSYDALSQWEKDIIQCTNVLTEFLDTGNIKFRQSKKFRKLDGAVGKLMQDYITYKMTFGVSTITVDNYKYHLQQFLHYLENCGIYDVNRINRSLLLNYVSQSGFCTPYVRHRNMSVLKGYLRFLYDKELTEFDLSKAIPKDKYVKQPKLPSTYSKDEVNAMIAVIDRGNPKGKRDYAMILITARLGLRATDVCTLTFNSILWEQNLIVLEMNKTKKRIELPLLQEIGDAIIDYLKYGRPKSELPYIFLHVTTPYDHLNRATLHSMVCLYLRRAGIAYTDIRKHGPHALRHSLAGILLEKKTPVPIISEVLGHTSIESTRYYLRIDINSLRQCALEVPFVSDSFYERKEADS